MIDNIISNILNFNVNQKDLFDISDIELRINKDFIDNPTNILKNIQKVILLDDFSIFSIIAAINAGFNIMLYGPPGTAKTTLSLELPRYIYNANTNLHTADTSWKVNKTIGGLSVNYRNGKEVIEPKMGIISRDIAMSYPYIKSSSLKFSTLFTIIDEFNRANIDECMGPLFTAMGSQYKILNLEFFDGFDDSKSSIPIPKSYRMICSMNKNDRIFTNTLSEALSRRFKWIYIGPFKDTSKEDSFISNILFNTSTRYSLPNCDKLVAVPKLQNRSYFNTEIKDKLLEIINNIKSTCNIELGMSYKLDSIKIAFHYNELLNYKLIADFKDQSISNFDLFKKNLYSDISFNDLLISINNNDLIQTQLHSNFIETIDAALSMCIIPACESIDDDLMLDDLKSLLSLYPNSLNELNRMRVI